MTLDDHLEHLVALLAPPYREAWREYVWQRAKDLSMEPGLAELPRLLTRAMRPVVTEPVKAALDARPDPVETA